MTTRHHIYITSAIEICIIKIDKFMFRNMYFINIIQTNNVW